MGVVISEYDLEYFKSIYPHLKMRRLTPQFEQALMYYLRGHTAEQASRAAGMNNTGPFRRYVESHEGQAIIQELLKREFIDVRINRDQITAMFMEAYQQSATAMEKIAAAKELGKLHGLYLDNKNTAPAVNVNVTQNGAGENTVTVTTKQIQHMSDEELIKLAPHLSRALTPPVPLSAAEDGEFYTDYEQAGPDTGELYEHDDTAG